MRRKSIQTRSHEHFVAVHVGDPGAAAGDWRNSTTQRLVTRAYSGAAVQDAATSIVEQRAVELAGPINVVLHGELAKIFVIRINVFPT
jgi:hypothetical protein